MPTHAAETENPGVGTAAKQVAAHASRLAKLRLELAKLQLKSKAAAVGFGLGALVLALYGIGFLFATIAVSLAIVLDAWLAMLLVTLGLFGLAATFGLLAREQANGHN